MSVVALPDTPALDGPARPAPFRRWLQLGADAASLDRVKTRPFDPVRAAHLEVIAATFVDGYNLMFETRPFGRLDRRLAETPVARRGFLVEGAAMGAAVRDALPLSSGMLARLHDRHGDRFRYLIRIGAGWAVARLPWRAAAIDRSLPPLLAALSLDGRGFHDAFFGPDRLVGGRLAHGAGDAARAYDQGIGRALWFVALGNVAGAAAHVRAFPTARRNALLSGLGLAMAYAGPTTADDWRRIRAAFPDDGPALAQGVAFAALAQDEAGHVTETLARATHALLDAPPEAAAVLANRTRPTARPDDRRHALALYEGWRRAIQADAAASTRAPTRAATGDDR